MATIFQLAIGHIINNANAAQNIAYGNFAADMEPISFALVMVSLGLAFIGGATFTAQKMSDPSTIVKSIPLEIIKDILASFVAGMMTFFLCEYFKVPTLLQLAGILISGYGGSRILERYLSSALIRIDKLAGKESP